MGEKRQLTTGMRREKRMQCRIETTTKKYLRLIWSELLHFFRNRQSSNTFPYSRRRGPLLLHITDVGVHAMNSRIWLSSRSWCPTRMREWTGLWRWEREREKPSAWFLGHQSGQQLRKHLECGHVWRGWQREQCVAICIYGCNASFQQLDSSLQVLVRFTWTSTTGSVAWSRAQYTIVQKIASRAIHSRETHITATATAPPKLPCFIGGTLSRKKEGVFLTAMGWRCQELGNSPSKAPK